VAASTRYTRRVPRPPRNLPIIRAAANFSYFAAQHREGTPVDTPGSHTGVAVDDSGGVVSCASENATGVEIEAQQEPYAGIEASPTFVLRGNVESDGSQVSNVVWDTPESSNFLHDWDGSSSEASVNDDDEDESSANEEPVPLVPAVRSRSPVRGAAPRVWEPDEDFVPPRGPSLGARPEFPQHRCVRSRSETQPSRTWRLGDGGPFRACSRAMFYSQPRTAAERASPPPSTRTSGARSDDTNSDEYNPGDEVMFDDPPENQRAGLHMRTELAAWRPWCTARDRLQRRRPHRPRGARGRAASVSRSVVSHPPGGPPVAHYEDLRDRRVPSPGPNMYVVYNLSQAFQQIPLDPTFVPTYVRARGSPDMAAVITEEYYRESVSLDPPSNSSTAWYGILDSGATCSILTGVAIDLFDSGSLDVLNSMIVNTASRGGSLRINAASPIGRFPEVYYADDLRHSIVAVTEPRATM
jgi:hypothetical protein